MEGKYKVSSNVKKTITYSLNKQKKTTFTDLEVSKRNFVPGVGKYNIERADSLITIGMRRSVYK
jgi:hypothetical protein